MNSVRRRVATNLQRQRLQLQWTLGDLSEQMHTKGVAASINTLSKIETGKRSARAEELVALAELFDVSADTLLGLDRGDNVGGFR